MRLWQWELEQHSWALLFQLLWCLFLQKISVWKSTIFGGKLPWATLLQDVWCILFVKLLKLTRGTVKMVLHVKIAPKKNKIMGVPKPVSDMLFLNETHEATCQEERYFKTRVFFQHLANNLVHLQNREKYERFRQTLCDKLLEWSTGNEYEQQIASDYGWIVEEL